VVANNLKVHACIAAKGGATTTFKPGDLVTLKIPPKQRLVGEALRLLVRVIKPSCQGYKLMSRHGELKGLYLASNLNPTDSSAELTLGHDISIQKPKKGEKLVLITLSKAV
jgi:hypothetical protein